LKLLVLLQAADDESEIRKQQVNKQAYLQNRLDTLSAVLEVLIFKVLD